MLWFLIKYLFFILVILTAFKLIRFTILTQRTLRQTKTKGIGPLEILFPVPTTGQEITQWTQVPGNLNEAGFMHLWLGPVLGILAASPDALKLILTHKTAISKNFANLPPSMRSWMNNNVVTADGDDWRRQRTAIGPAFKTEAYRQYYPTFLRMTTKILDIFAKQPEQDISLLHLMKAFTIDTLGHTIFHYDFGCLDGENNPYYEAYNKVMTNAFSKKLFLVLPWLEYFPIAPAVALKEGIAKLSKLFQKMISEHRKASFSEVDVLSNMLNAQDQGSLSKEELDANLFILFLAGHDTTSSALVYALLELAKRPEIQTKLRVEILNVVGNSEPTLDQLNGIPYLDWFIDEVLRWHPPVPIIFSRSIVQDIDCGNNIILPKGSMVGLNILAPHFSQEHWVEPYEFNPERFSPANSKGRHKFAYLPFSLGLRQCVGMGFSLVEQKLFLVRALQRFLILPPQSGNISFDRDFGSSVEYPQVADLRFKPIGERN